MVIHKNRVLLCCPGTDAECDAEWNELDYLEAQGISNEQDGPHRQLDVSGRSQAAGLLCSKVSTPGESIRAPRHICQHAGLDQGNFNQV